MTTSKSHYNTLGVDPKSTQDEIKKNFYKLARIYHPDKNSDPKAEEKFKEINNAYEILSDASKKLTYDLSHSKPFTSTSTTTTSSSSKPQEKPKAEPPKKDPYKPKYSYQYESNWSKYFKRDREDEENFDFTEFCQKTPRSTRSNRQKEKPRQRRPSFAERPSWNEKFAEEFENEKKEEARKEKKEKDGSFTFHFKFTADFDPSNVRRGASHEYRSDNNSQGASFSFWFGNGEAPGNNEEESELSDEKDESFETEFVKRNKTFAKENSSSCTVQCKHCGEMMDVDALIKHEPDCKGKEEDFYDEIDLMDPRRFKHWKDIHHSTLHQIRRDKRRVSTATSNPRHNTNDNKRTPPTDPDLDEDLHGMSDNPGLLRCPYCYRSFNRSAASSHVPFCRSKWEASGGRAPNPLGKPVNSDYASKNAKAKEYARKLNRPQFRKTSAAGKSKPSDDDDDEEEDDEYADNAFKFASAGKSKTTFPNIGKQKPNPNKPGVKKFAQKSKKAFKADLSDFEVKNTPRGTFGAGCASCTAQFGAENAPFVCSCGTKKAARF